MSTNNCKLSKEDYSMDDLADALGKLEGGGGTRDTDDISDDVFSNRLYRMKIVQSVSFFCQYLHRAVCTWLAAEKLFAVAAVIHPCTII